MEVRSHPTRTLNVPSHHPPDLGAGMDFLCGRLVYYDEVSQDFAATSGDRIE
jgi:hypothetical protein